MKCMSLHCTALRTKAEFNSFLDIRDKVVPSVCSSTGISPNETCYLLLARSRTFLLQQGSWFHGKLVI
jgi:hypothetical protein